MGPACFPGLQIDGRWSGSKCGTPQSSVCNNQSRVAEHHLSAHKWLDDGMFLAGCHHAAAATGDRSPRPVHPPADAGALPAHHQGPRRSRGGGSGEHARSRGAATSCARASTPRPSSASDSAGTGGAGSGGTSDSVGEDPRYWGSSGSSGGGASSRAGSGRGERPRRWPQHRDSGGGRGTTRHRRGEATSGRWAATSGQVHVEFMVVYRRIHAARAGDTSGSHVCGWCGHVEANISHLRAHMQRPNCATAGASVAGYYRALGMNKWHTCDAETRVPRPRAHMCAARLPLGSRNGPSMGANTSDGRRPELTTSAMPCGDGATEGTGGRAASGGSSGAGRGPGATRTGPHEIVRCFTADLVAAAEIDTKTAELWDVLCGSEQSTPRTQPPLHACRGNNAKIQPRG
jgi:hypothetical protein